MPVTGLPATLEYVVNSLVSTNGLSSFKIASNPDATTVVLRFRVMADHGMDSAYVESGFEGSLRAPTPCPTGLWHRKSPNRVRRDNHRLNSFITTKNYEPVTPSSSSTPAMFKPPCHARDNSPHEGYQTQSETINNQLAWNVSQCVEAVETDSISTGDSVSTITRDDSVNSALPSNTTDQLENDNTRTFTPADDSSGKDKQTQDININNERDVMSTSLQDTNTKDCKDSLVSSRAPDYTACSIEKDMLPDSRDNPVLKGNQQCELGGEMDQGEETHAVGSPSASVPNPSFIITYPTQERFAEVHKTSKFKDYVKKLNCPDLKTKLKDASWSENSFRKVVLDSESNHVIAHTIDDLVVVCDTNTHTMTYWFSTDAKLGKVEKEVMKTLKLLEDLDCDVAITEQNLAGMCEDYLRYLVMDEIGC